MAERRICYLTGTRAEFGLMRTGLDAIRNHQNLRLQLLVTGMHLSKSHGRSVDRIRRDGWEIDAVIPWKETSNKSQLAIETGRVTTRIAESIAKIKPDLVLVCGDRVEPFAAASAAHLAGIPIAHVHGGDRAMGQVDDSLRHAITKLAHLHFCATHESAERVFALGEQRNRIHVVGAPGIDDLKQLASRSPMPQSDILLILHPESCLDKQSNAHAKLLISAAFKSGAESIAIINSNNDPGWKGIQSCWKEHMGDPRIRYYSDLDRGAFAGLMKSSRLMLGNSSAGIIEAASMGLWVINVGSRQAGRQKSQNVTSVTWSLPQIVRQIKHILDKSGVFRYRGRNVYGGGNAGKSIASILADVHLDEKLVQKLIRY